MTKQITITKTITVQCGTHTRMLPGDQRFILWYGLAVGQLAVASRIGDLVQSVKTPDGREWLLESPVKETDAAQVIHDADVGASLDDPHGPLLASNPWCPKGLEKAWYECAIRRVSQHSPREEA